MQYMAWPDHGVPVDSSDFLNFVSQVRGKRAETQEPVVVHCRSGLKNASLTLNRYQSSSKPRNIVALIINAWLSSCSAGIGRTGVLITMETAMCLIESGQPVYPLDIVRTMRDQRAMMIQTPVSIRATRSRATRSLILRINNLTFCVQSQYRFVCEAILKVYEEEIVKPCETEPTEKEE